MKKILLIGMTSGVGGIETFIMNLLDRVDRSKYSIDLLLFQDVDEKFSKNIKKARHVFKVRSVRHHPIGWFFDIIKFYFTHKYDIVHANECSAKTFLYCWPIIFQKNVRFIVHSHNGSDSGKFMHFFMRPIQQIFTTDRWSCSTEASKWMFGKEFMNKYHVVDIKNGIDVSKYRFSKTIRDNYRNRLHVDSNTVVVGSIARLEEQKNHAFLLKIFKNYLDRNPNSLLLIAGEGSLKKQLVNETGDLGIKSRVKFLGNRNDIPNLLQAMDILMMPSLYEGMPFIGMEAQAAGIPIVASDSVDHDLNITNQVTFLKLSDPVSVWCDQMNSSLKNSVDREDFELFKSCFLKEGYLISYTIDKIEKEYDLA
ncbi:glycosyltransferase family 1 protein [Levilactobacillus hammesii]|uniref:Glycosyltransferase n=1 Tax=Levilactobacillus hammesii DSM 16381 TaxID=1423753 RepID=A0A0R1ULZ0_9LACO|nr:glycosyltransferase family 1 protein [Levilactobacillus hammesii]KRL94205.1 glycosyltransferase [Levilactobacillus hammesii DSM 16381]